MTRITDDFLNVFEYDKINLKESVEQTIYRLAFLLGFYCLG